MVNAAAAGAEAIQITVSFVELGIVAGLLVVIWWFLVRTINKIDKNQSLLFTELTKVSKSHFQLLGEHKGYIKGGAHTCPLSKAEGVGR